MSLAIYKFLLILSICFIISALVLTSFSLFSPSWEIVDFPRSHLSHQHGIWWDCIVHHSTLIPLSEVQAEQRGDRCESKMDSVVQATLRVALERGDDEARELLLHRFLPHHKGVIFFAVFTFVFGLLSIVIGGCSPCFPPNSLLYIVGVFMTAACSILGDITFLFAYSENQLKLSSAEDEQHSIQKSLGLACYIHVLSSALLIISFFLTIFCSYFLIISKEAHDVCCTGRKDYHEQSRWKNSGIVLKTGSSLLSRPFIVIDDDVSI